MRQTALLITVAAAILLITISSFGAAHSRSKVRFDEAADAEGDGHASRLVQSLRSCSDESARQSAADPLGSGIG